MDDAYDNREPKITPCGQTRREFLWQSGAGFGGVALLDFLTRDGFFREAHAAEIKGAPAGDPSLNPLLSRAGHFAPKAKSVIFLFMFGGPSHMDLFDRKPELEKNNGKEATVATRAGESAKGKLLASTRTWKRYGKSGLEVSDLYANVGECADDLAILKGCYADSFAHGSALIQMNTGSVRLGSPSVGAWTLYGLGSENQNLPGFVVLLDQRGGPISGAPNWGAGYMPAAYQGTPFRSMGQPIVDLSAPAGIGKDRQRSQLDFINELNRNHAHERPKETELAARIASYELAFRMQAHAPEVIDLSKETEETKTLYGMDKKPSEDFGRRCLLARRLVERGVRFVQVYSGGGGTHWDAHDNVNGNHGERCAETDRPIAGLLTDLKRRGLLDETLVVWGGEFGRMPTSQGNGGRDHNPHGFTMFMAGGGVKGGIAYGATNEIGHSAAEGKAHVHDLHATILHLMGLDHTKLTYFFGGRNMRLTDVHGNVIKNILA
ncbi:MAG: DUF1501 domain-containing protein [Armatimonadetes bacterium]|nr:DUF1501 domain-containing protein [Armatimonadota bacterium]